MAAEHTLATRPPGGPQRIAPRSDSLADVLERVLDKGVVIVGDVVVSVLDVELLTLKLRLFIASADTARQMGLDWWTSDPFYNSNAAALQNENRALRARLEDLEALPRGGAASHEGTRRLARDTCRDTPADTVGDTEAGQVVGSGTRAAAAHRGPFS